MKANSITNASELPPRSGHGPRSSTGSASRRGSAQDPAPRVLELLDRLRAFYGALPAPPTAPFALYVWEVLSVGTTASRRDAAYNALRRLPALTPDSVGRAPQAKLEGAIAHAGPLKDERISALRAGADLFRGAPTLLDDLTGPFGKAIRAVRRLPHLGRASMLRLLLFSAGHPVLPLDQHALRVAERLGYGRGANLSGSPGRPVLRRRSGHPEPRSRDEPLALSAERSARMAILSESGREPSTLRAISQFFTHHGLATCLERAPHCGVCPLAADCEWLKLQ